MTRQRYDEHSTEFGLWLRKPERKEIDSSLGFVTTNIDYIWKNYKTGKYMLIEEKRYLSKLTYSQSKIMQSIDNVLKKDSNYCGFYLLQFEKTNPDDGKIFLNSIEITKNQLIEFLCFEVKIFRLLKEAINDKQ